MKISISKNSLIALAIGLIMVSCGSGNSNNQQQSATAEKSSSKAATVDRSSISAFLSSYGLSESGIKPEGATEGVINSVDDKTSWKDRAFINYTVDGFTVELKTSILTNAYNATKKAADDGKVYQFAYLDREYKSIDDVMPSNINIATFAKSWEYKYKGEIIKFELGWSEKNSVLTVSIFKKI